jgi:hypothetical protein
MKPNSFILSVVAGALVSLALTLPVRAESWQSGQPVVFHNYNAANNQTWQAGQPVAMRDYNIGQYRTYGSGQPVEFRQYKAQ